MTILTKHSKLDQILANQAWMIAQIRQLSLQGNRLMATVADLTAAVATVAADITQLATDVAALQSRGGISPSDLDPVLTALQGAASALSSLDASIQPAPPPPPPPPVA